jgi:hypothetical protein
MGLGKSGLFGALQCPENQCGGLVIPTVWARQSLVAGPRKATGDGPSSWRRPHSLLASAQLQPEGIVIQSVDRFSPLLNCVNPARVRSGDGQTTQTKATGLSGQHGLLDRPS